MEFVNHESESETLTENNEIAEHENAAKNVSTSASTANYSNDTNDQNESYTTDEWALKSEDLYECTSAENIDRDDDVAELSCDSMMTLEEIDDELQWLTDMANSGRKYDEKRMDYLINLQNEHPDFKAKVAAEHKAWEEKHSSYIAECLSMQRSFVPLNVFKTTQENLISCGLTPECAKRVLTKECLWMVRMSPDEISRLHEADLITRFSMGGQILDIVETAAIYASLPTEFPNDPTGRKIDYRISVEDTLKRMLIQYEEGSLPAGKTRALAYASYNGGSGPFEDRTSVRKLSLLKSSDVVQDAFLEQMRGKSSILSAIKGKSRAKSPVPKLSQEIESAETES